jgi:O-antigen/teichoic acid export membrane protein
VDLGLVRELLKVGGLFFVIQLTLAVTAASNNLVLTLILGTEASAQYSVPAQLFALFSTFLALFFAPLWPAYAEAFKSNDHAWIQRTFRHSTLFAFSITTVCVTALILLAERLITLWIGDTVVIPFALIVPLGLYQILMSLTHSYAMYLNGAGHMSFQTIVAVVTAIANLLLSIYLTTQIGVAGVAWGSVIAQLTCFIIPYTIYIWRKQRLERLSQPITPKSILP